MYDILPGNREHALQGEFHGWDKWAEEVEELAGDRPVVFTNSYQKAAKYLFYDDLLFETPGLLLSILNALLCCCYYCIFSDCHTVQVVLLLAMFFVSHTSISNWFTMALISIGTPVSIVISFLLSSNFKILKSYFPTRSVSLIE